MESFYKGKDILVTGGAGSIGSEIVRQLLKFDVKRVRVLDIHESGVFWLVDRLSDKRLRAFVGDVRDRRRLTLAMDGVDIVFHAAALKHVPICEYNPHEAVMTNVMGTWNVFDVAREKSVDRVINISTDKAVEPISIMGTTKLLGEKLAMSMSCLGTKYSCVRFGNVINSSGSVIPVFKEQIMRGGPVTITSEGMTRFFMSISDAVSLVLRCGHEMKDRETYILKMKALRISDLADVLIGNMCVPGQTQVVKEIVGIRPNERLYEALLSDEETRRVEIKDDMFVLRPTIDVPHYTEVVKLRPDMRESEYRSDEASHLSKREIYSMLKAEKIL